MSALMPLLTRYSKVFLFIAVAFTLDKRGIRLHSGDWIEIGSVSYEITIID